MYGGAKKKNKGIRAQHTRTFSGTMLPATPTHFSGVIWELQRMSGEEKLTKRKSKHEIDFVIIIFIIIIIIIMAGA